MGSPIQSSRSNSPDHEIPGFLVGRSGCWGPEMGDDELLHDIHPQLLWHSHSARLSPIPLFRSEWMSRTVLVPQPGLFLTWPGVSADEERGASELNSTGVVRHQTRYILLRISFQKMKC